MSNWQMDETDRKIIKATQEGLPLVEAPYEAVGAEIGLSGDEVRQRLNAMLDAGVIRRIGAVPNHYALGYTANGMSTWDVPDEKVKKSVKNRCAWILSAIVMNARVINRSGIIIFLLWYMAKIRKPA